jgi:hypothetical protein
MVSFYQLNRKLFKILRMGNGAISCCESSSLIDDQLFQSPSPQVQRPQFPIQHEYSQSKFQTTQPTHPGKSQNSQDSKTPIKPSKTADISIPSSFLLLKVLSSSVLSKDIKFIITPEGLLNSKRLLKDGRVFFGSIQEHKGKIINDVVIPSQNNDSKKFPHFQINFSLSKDRFFIKDLGKGFGVYNRITSSLMLKTGIIVNIGSQYLTFVVNEEFICVKILGSTSREFRAEMMKDMSFTIGRHEGVDRKLHVGIDDHLLSKVHCVVYFLQGKWNLVDGDLQKNSTNGTWVYIDEKYQMHTSMVFKYNQTVFQVLSSSHSSETFS